jgi:dTDP-4-amino-4,6-dideoxygalactose transaminase
MSKLALLGGNPVFERSPDWRTFWPPVDDATERRLVELYRSGKWTAFDDAEPTFTQAFAAHHGARYGIFTINGTITLHSALAAYGIGPGDEVIVPPLTWYATAIAVRHVGATPVFVDIEPDTLCLDPERLEAAITPRSRAIIPVHAYGSMADLDRILAIARRHDLRVIEDCAHVPGGIWGGKGIGTVGDVGSFSFQHTKTMSSGEGGISLTNDPDVADRLFRIKQIGYGFGELPRHAKSPPPPGLLCYNFRATAFHPVILQQQLTTLNERLDRYTRVVQDLEKRLAQSTQIRFQRPGRKAERQSRFGWVTIFDAPQYADIPIEIIHQAIQAEGLPMFRAEGPIYRFVLFNVAPSDYRLDSPCTVTELACARGLWLLHAFLGLEQPQLEKIAETLEKVVSNVDALRKHARAQ